LTVVGALELCGRDVAVVGGDLAMKQPVVQPVDVAEDGELDAVTATRGRRDGMSSHMWCPLKLSAMAES
jgi:hypothetical protein